MKFSLKKIIDFIINFWILTLLGMCSVLFTTKHNFFLEGIVVGYFWFGVFFLTLYTDYRHQKEHVGSYEGWYNDKR